MTIYKLLPDYESYRAFTLPMKDVLLALGKKISPPKLMHFYKHNLSLANEWTNISANFEPVEGVTVAGLIPDLTMWVPGTLVLSDLAIKELPDMTAYGELLPVDTPSGQYWVLNCMKEIKADEQRSKHNTVSGQVLDVESLQFPEDEANQAGLFKTSFDGYRNVFCSAELMDTILKSKLGGLKFSENLAGGFE